MKPCYWEPARKPARKPARQIPGRYSQGTPWPAGQWTHSIILKIVWRCKGGIRHKMMIKPCQS